LSYIYNCGCPWNDRVQYPYTMDIPDD
jgi:hypothetical protein